VLLWTTIGHQILLDVTWVLPLLISTAVLFLYLATYVLRSMLREMEVRLKTAQQNDDVKPLVEGLISNLSDVRFLAAGFFFGALNAYLGYKFGLPYCAPIEHCYVWGVLENWQGVGILVSYFAAGFACGMPVLGILGVCTLINDFAGKARKTFDQTAPDGCAGTSFIGEALIIFSTVTLIVGVMISIYIVRTQWTEAHVWWVEPLKRIWIAFPYLMSLVVLVVPCLPMVRELRAYKFEKERSLKERLAGLRKELGEGPIDPETQKADSERVQMVQKVWNDLYQVRLWPLGMDVNSKYLSALAGGSILHVVGTLKEIPSWLTKLIAP
jgi:hypothetical protein